MARVISLDMADWWQPTASNFFDRVPKESILSAVSEGASVGNTARLRALKKRQMSTAAEKVLAGRRWLPEPLKHHNEAFEERAKSEEQT